MHIDEYREFHCSVPFIFGILMLRQKHNQRTKLAFYCVLRDPVDPIKRKTDNEKEI